MEKGVNYFLTNPKMLAKSSGKFIRNIYGKGVFLNTSSEYVNDCKKKARQILENQNNVEAQNYIAQLENEIIERETDHKTGNERIVLSSSKPLSPKELEELAGVDNISTFIDRSWLKSHKNGTWTYSILTVCKIKDFYTEAELTQKLKKVFENIQPHKLKPVKTDEQKALFIYIGDDHVGLVLKNSLFEKEYSGSIYAKRLLNIVEEIKNLDTTFEEINIIRLGDELDGWDAKTCRKDHSLDSLSNKEQFDIYTVANKIFYSELFQSNLSQNYRIINLSNSNHSGLGFSYIANKALEFWLEAKFPEVQIIHQSKFIDTYFYGNHVIAFTHGKDEKYMKSPMPLNLDYKTDVWLMDYFKRFVQDDKYVSLIKADIHKYNINTGKFGRYINVPSISSGSSWIEHNFGDSNPGVLLEIYKPFSKNVQSIPIWFKDEI